MRILHYIQSANRLEFLEPTLKSIKNLDFGKHQVDHLFIDDYPKGRDEDYIRKLVGKYGFDDCHFHQGNWGVTRTWGHMWSLTKHKGYDYYFHQEDDSVIPHKIKIDDLIKMMEERPDLSQISFKRQEWYGDKKKDGDPLDPDDEIIGKYRLERGTRYFLTAASLYPGWIAREPLKMDTYVNPGEGTVCQYLNKKYNLVSGKLKLVDGSHLCEHIGEYFHGTRTQPCDGGYAKHAMYKFGHKYCSKTGKYLEEEL